MSDHSLTSGYTFISKPTKREEKDKTMAVEEPKLRPRRPMYDLLKIEEVDCKYKDLILTLPFEQQWALRQYKGFWEWERQLPGVLIMQEVFNPRQSDIIVASFHKSGTTWLKALVFTIVYRDKYTFSDHPLLKLSPHDCVRQIEESYALHDEQYLQTLPVPCVLGTHAAYQILPESIKASKCCIIYICREPKDVVVSFWHMMSLTSKDIRKVEPLPFAQTFELFCMGKVPHGPIWDHVPEYYKRSLHDPNKILFLRYEEMMSNPIDGVTRIANFISSPFSEEVEKGVVEEIVRFCSFGNMKNLDVSRNVGVDGEKNHYFFRKAVVGDWQNHLTTKMASKLDEIIKEKLKGSGFTF